MSVSNSRSSTRKRKNNTPNVSKEPENNAPGKGWTDDEVSDLIKAICGKGHTDFEAIQKALPQKSIEAYKMFLRKVHSSAISSATVLSDDIAILNNWLLSCTSESNKHELRGNLKEPIEISVILKLLSVNGLIEHHPLPQNCEGVDFGACYRLLSQAVMGHPIQPVNKQTIQLIYDTVSEICSLLSFNDDLVKKLKNVLDKNTGNPTSEFAKSYSVELPKKAPLRSYQSKKKVTINAEKVDIRPPDGVFEDVGFNPLKIPPEWLYNTNLNLILK